MSSEQEKENNRPQAMTALSRREQLALWQEQKRKLKQSAPSKAVGPSKSATKSALRPSSASGNVQATKKPARVTSSATTREAKEKQGRQVSTSATKELRPHSLPQPAVRREGRARSREQRERKVATHERLERLFFEKIEKAMQQCADGNLDAAQASLESLLDNRFDKFRDRSHYWIARARYAEACENYTEVIRLLDQGLARCSTDGQGMWMLGNALASFLMRADDATRAARSLIESGDSTPGPNNRPMSPFYFNELAPEYEEVLFECLQKGAEPGEEDVSRSPCTPAHCRQKLQQVVEAIKSSPLTASLTTKRTPISFLPAPLVSAPLRDSGIPVPDLNNLVTQQDPLRTPYSSFLPPSPSPPDLSETTRILLTPGAASKALFPKSPCAPSLTPTTRQVLGQSLERDEPPPRPAVSPYASCDGSCATSSAAPITIPSAAGTSPVLLARPQRIPVVRPTPSPDSSHVVRRARRISLPTADGHYDAPGASAVRRAATVQRPQSKARLARGSGKELMLRALHNRSAQLFPAQSTKADSEALAPSPTLDLPEQNEPHADCTGPSSDTWQEESSEVRQNAGEITSAESSSFSLLSLSSADVSLSESAHEQEGSAEENDHREQEATPQQETVAEPPAPAPSTPKPASQDEQLRGETQAAAAHGITPRYGRYNTFAPVRRTSSMRYATPDVSCLASPITPVSPPAAAVAVPTPAVKALTPFHHLHRRQDQAADAAAQQEPTAEAEIFVTPVRRSLRLNYKTNAVTARLPTPHPTARRAWLRVEQDKKDQAVEQKQQTPTTPTVDEATVAGAAVQENTNARINYKRSTPEAKQPTPFPYARRQAQAGMGMVVVLSNRHLASVPPQ